jgi:penicillin-binding protein 2
MDYRERWELKEYQSEQRLGRRANLIHAVIILVLLGFLGAFWYLQVVQGDTYALLAENNRLRRIPLPPTRGVVLDRKQQVLASTRPALNLVLVREGLTDAEGQLKRLEHVLGFPYAELKARLDAMRVRPTFEPLVIKEDVNLADLSKVEARREWFPSVEVEETRCATIRTGPRWRTRSGTSGRSARRSSRRRSTARSSRGTSSERRDRARLRRDLARAPGLEAPDGEQRRPAVRGVAARAPAGGRSAAGLSIDKKLQRALVEALAEEVGPGSSWTRTRGGLGARVDARIRPQRLHGPRVADDVARPHHGSQEASARPRDRVVLRARLDVQGPHVDRRPRDRRDHAADDRLLRRLAFFYDRNFLCWKKGGHGTVAVHQALVHSCNVFFYTLGRKLGSTRSASTRRCSGSGR